MNLDQVKTFVEVARSGSFSAAARRLGVPRTTISARVNALETQLKAPLLRRSTRRIVLTETGKSLYQQVQSAIETLERVEHSFNSPEAPLSGLVRCTVPQDFPQEVLEKTLVCLKNSHPMIKVELLFSNAVSQLVAEDIDVAIRVGEPALQSLVIRRLGSTEFTIVATEKYLNEYGYPASINDLQSHRILAYTSGAEAGKNSPLKSWAEVTKDPVLGSSSMTFLRRMACNNFGITCLPFPICEQEIKTNILKNVEIKGLDLQQDVSIYLVFPSHRDITDRVRLFADHLLMALNS